MRRRNRAPLVVRWLPLVPFPKRPRVIYPPCPEAWGVFIWFGLSAAAIILWLLSGVWAAWRGQ